MQESDKLKNWKKPLNRKGGSTLKRRDKMPEGKVRIMIYLLAPKVLHKLQKKQNGVYFCSDISLKKSSRLEIMICN